MERSVSVSFDRNIRDHLWRWSTYFGRIPTEICRSTFHKPVLCPNKLGNSEEKFEMTRAISIGWPSLIGKCRSIFLRYSHWSLTGQFGIMASTPGFVQNRKSVIHGLHVKSSKSDWLQSRNLVPRAFSSTISKWRIDGRRPWHRLVSRGTKSPKILEIFITWHFEKGQNKMAAKHRVGSKTPVKERFNFVHEAVVAS